MLENQFIALVSLAISPNLKLFVNKNFNYLYFQVSPSHSISCARSYRLFAVLTTSSMGMNDEGPTGKNTTNWMGRRWNLEIKVIPILISTEIFLSAHETWYLINFDIFLMFVQIWTFKLLMLLALYLFSEWTLIPKLFDLKFLGLPT